MGNTAYAYDNAGRPAWSAKGSSVPGSTTTCDNSDSYADKVTFVLNNLGQTTNVSFNDSSPDKAYVYDPNGSVTRMTAGSVTTDMTYNSADLLEKETMRVDGRSFTLDYVYNSNRNLTNTIYPSGANIAYAPNALGQATRAGNYATAATYFANGSMTSHSYGNGFAHTATQYTSGLPKTFYDRKNSTDAINHGFTYDANNNVTFLDDKVSNAYDLRFTFDGLDRLDKITDSYLGTGDVNYDTMGNITYYKLGSRTINYVYNSKKQLAYTSGSKAYNFAYDDKGNVTDNGTRVFDYNTANQMVKSGGYSYTYDANNKRVRQEDSKGISYSFYGSNGKLMYRNANNKHIDYYYLGGKLVAKNKDDTITYLHSDYLGSTAAESNDVNSSIYRMHYQPFGESIETPKDDVGYTGHKFDTDLGLSYMQARYYDPVIGRFYSNDPVGYTASNPVMSFNRYLYVNNNPYKYTDPNGEFLLKAATIVADVIDLGADLAAGNYGSAAVTALTIIDPTGISSIARRGVRAVKAAKALKAGCSFTPETMILTKDGYKTIIKVNIGDIVLSKNDQTGEVSWQEVTDTFKDWHTETITFTVVDENGIEESITTTAEHPFYVDNQGWLPASEIASGTVISGPKASNNINITSIEVSQEPQYAYNFTVDTDHTYFVGKTNMWVHNACNKSGKLVTGKTQPKVGDKINTGEYSNRVKVTNSSPKMVNPKTGNYIQKDNAKNSGAGPHGTSENKLFDKKGGRVGTVDKDGNITRE